MSGRERTFWTDAEPDERAFAEWLRPGPGGGLAANPSGTPECPPPDLLRASKAGVLPGALEADVAGHVERCLACQALVEALDDPSVGDITTDERARILSRIRSGVQPATPRRRGAWMWRPLPLLTAAAAAVVIVGMALLWQVSGPVVEGPQRTRPRGTGVPAVFRLEKAEIRQPATDVLRWRGVEGEVRGELDDLTRALDPYRRDDYAEAASRLADVTRQYPDSAAGHFYLGVSLLFLDRPADAVAALQSAERLVPPEPGLASDVAWYLALAYQRAGQRERAAATLTRLCEGTSDRSARACEGLTELSRPPAGTAPR